MQRKNNASRKSGGDQIHNNSDSMNEKVEIIPSDFSSWQRDPSGQSSKTALTNIPTSNGHIINGTSKLSHPAAHIGRPSTSPSLGADGFEHIRAEDDDDLFAFDEDIRYRDEDQETQEEKDGEEDIEESAKVELLPTSSPHAGSLPIEIKWPGRKDPRG